MSFFRATYKNKPDAYTISEEKETFIVDIKHSTINEDVENTIKKLEKHHGVSFTIVDKDTIRVSISANGTFAENDAAFRNALGVLNANRLTTLNLEGILDNYKTFLKAHDLYSATKTHAHEAHHRGNNLAH